MFTRTRLSVTLYVQRLNCYSEDGVCCVFLPHADCVLVTIEINFRLSMFNYRNTMLGLELKKHSAYALGDSNNSSFICLKCYFQHFSPPSRPSSGTLFVFKMRNYFWLYASVRMLSKMRYYCWLYASVCACVVDHSILLWRHSDFPESAVVLLTSKSASSCTQSTL